MTAHLTRDVQETDDRFGKLYQLVYILLLSGSKMAPFYVVFIAEMKLAFNTALMR